VDGLREPLNYLKRLRSIPVGAMCERHDHTPYVVVEKILAIGETLPDKWPVEGTSGYDFLNEVTGLFIDAPGLKTLQRHYRETTKTRRARDSLTIANKRMVLEQSFRPELARLASALMPAAEWLYPTDKLTNARLSRAIIDVTAALPVYRTYFTARSGFSPQDRRHIERALSQAASHLTRDTDDVAFEVVERALNLDIPRSAPTRVRQAVQEFLLRWQQLSGAAMAKGFEDTTLYQDGAFIALNDVGAPETFAPTTPEQFHNRNSLRCADWPHTMNCTATHDTKRGEDIRARLAVLSEAPQAWTAAVDRWFALLATNEAAGDVVRVIDASTHLFLLQTIVGALPENESPDTFAERLTQYMVKVAREAKTRSSWLEPDEEYERALGALVRYAVSDETATRFGDCFGELIATLRFHGLVNSLAQALLKIASPGVPDLYQGTELLDLSLVDPDNRRPVDYEPRRALLQQLQAHAADRQQLARQLVAGWPDERAKLYVTTQALKLRQRLVQVFQDGEYTPLTCRGTQGQHACAFMRRHKGDCAIAVAPVRSLNLAGERRLPLGAAAWGTTAITLPPGSPENYEDVFTGASVSAVKGVLKLAGVLQQFPVALLKGCLKR
jgi:(1->4)-alpha-D-glucan 1-alpha-D-glucosylmutase